MSQTLMTRLKSTIFYLLIADLVVFYIFHFSAFSTNLIFGFAIVLVIPMLIYLLPWSGLVLAIKKLGWFSSLSLYVLNCFIMGSYIKWDFPWPLTQDSAGLPVKVLPMYYGQIILITAIIYILLITSAFVLNLYSIYQNKLQHLISKKTKLKIIKYSLGILIPVDLLIFYYFDGSILNESLPTDSVSFYILLSFYFLPFSALIFSHLSYSKLKLWYFVSVLVMIFIMLLTFIWIPSGFSIQLSLNSIRVDFRNVMVLITAILFLALVSTSFKTNQHIKRQNNQINKTKINR